LIERDIIEKCRAWKVHRDFLKSLNINVDNMPEEIQYQRDIREYKFKQRMLVIRNNATMRHLFKLDFIKEFNDKVKDNIGRKMAPMLEDVPEEEEPMDLDEMDTDADKNERIIIQMNRRENDTTSNRSNDIAQSIKDEIESSLGESVGSNMSNNYGSSVMHSNRMSSNAS
jgi:hypothetical protein